jgi:hypothetical protein
LVDRIATTGSSLEAITAGMIPARMPTNRQMPTASPIISIGIKTLKLGDEGVARGYLNCEELMRERFIAQVTGIY